MADEQPYIAFKAVDASAHTPETSAYSPSTNSSIYETGIFETRIYDRVAPYDDRDPSFDERDQPRNQSNTIISTAPNAESCCLVSLIKIKSKWSIFNETYNIAFLCCIFRID